MFKNTGQKHAAEIWGAPERAEQIPQKPLAHLRQCPPRTYCMVILPLHGATSLLSAGLAGQSLGHYIRLGFAHLGQHLHQ